MILPQNVSKRSHSNGLTTEFEFLKPFSQSYLATVWLVKDTKTQRQFVLKVIPKQRLLTRETVNQVLVEQLILQQRLTPQIVQLYSNFTDSQNLYFQLEYLEGGNLANYLEKSKDKINNSQRRQMMAQIINSLQACHMQGIIHGDLKAENILVASDGTLRLADFGSSKVVHLPGKNDVLYQQYLKIVEKKDSASKDQQNKSTGSKEGRSEDQQMEKLIRVGKLGGTMQYISPEAIRGEEYDFSNDFWALGVLAHKMFSERFPFNGVSEMDLINAIECKLPVIDRTIPEDIQELIEGLLTPVKSDRLGCKHDSIESNYDELKANLLLKVNSLGPKELDSRTSLTDQLELQKASVSTRDEETETTARAQRTKWLFWKENVILRMGSHTIRVTREEDKKILREFPINGILRATSHQKETLCIQSGSQKFSCQLIGEKSETWVNMIQSATQL